MWTVTVMDYERVVRYRHGRLAEVLAPGRHRLWGLGQRLHRVDLRERVLTMPVQELVTADGVTAKVSLAATWRVADPVAFVQAAESVRDAVYVQLQLALREPVAAAGVAELLGARSALGEQVRAAAAAAVARYGVEVDRVAIRDLGFPGELKALFADVVRARQEGLAALERARGETAALRALANASALLDKHPGLLQLRTLQVAEGSGTQLVLFGAPRP